MHKCDIGNLELLSPIRWQRLAPEADWATLYFVHGTNFITLLASVIVVQAIYEKYYIIG